MIGEGANTNGESRENCILYFGYQAEGWNHECKLAGIRRFAAARGWRVVPIPLERSHALDAAVLLRQLRPVGCLVEQSFPQATSGLTPRIFGKTPVVYIDPALRRNRGAPSVVCDDSAVARAAFNALSAGMPPCYAVASYRRQRQWARSRVAEFRNLCREAGKPCFVLPERPGEEGDDNPSRAARLARWAASLPQHVAVFAVNDFTAGEMARAFRAVLRTIPRSATLIGVDGNSSLAGDDGPRISSVKLDFERMGFVAARALAEHTAGKIGPLMVEHRESTRGRGRREHFVLEAVGAIRREACEGVSAAEIAARFPVSRNLFERRFREAMGHSPLEEIQRVRMEQAQALLARPDLLVSAIADFCGFPSERDFHKIFLKRTGLSPLEWRKRHYE